MFKLLKKQCVGQGGFGHVLAISLPLILSSGAHTVQMFIDRVFLAKYDLNMMPAAMQGGLLSFTIAALFLGVVSYTSTFVAQYSGAGRNERIGPSVWQGIYFSLLSGLSMLLLVAVAKPLFDFIGHDTAIRVHEVVYFRIMCLGSLPMLLGAAMSSFFTGRGKTWTVLWVSSFGAVANIILDYCLIFGNLGLPEMGITGAGIATVIANFMVFLIYAVIFFLPKYERRFKTISGAKLDFALCRRMIKFGFPSGFQFMLDMLAFSLFLAFVGQMGKIEQIATNMTFSISMLSFLPMIGMGMGVSVIVGNSLGKDDVLAAKRCTWSAFAMSSAYMILVGVLFAACPDWFLGAFRPSGNVEEFAAVNALGRRLLMFIAIYCLFDTGNIIFAATLKGAGDTKFVMFVSVSLHWIMMTIPAYLLIRNGFSIYWAWGCITLFIFTLAVVFYLRFLGGKWQSMRVIEKSPAIIPVVSPETPAAIEN